MDKIFISKSSRLAVELEGAIRAWELATQLREFLKEEGQLNYRSNHDFNNS